MLHLPTNIKLIRQLRQETQAEFAAHFSNITPAKQKSYESGKAKPSELYLRQLSKLSGYSQDELLNKEVKVEKVENGSIQLKDEPADYKSNSDSDKHKDEIIALLKKHNDDIIKLALSKDAILSAITEVKTNLTDAAEKQQIFRVMTNSGQQVTLETLAELRGLNKHELVNRARSIGDALLHDTDETYNSDS